MTFCVGVGILLFHFFLMQWRPYTDAHTQFSIMGQSLSEKEMHVC